MKKEKKIKEEIIDLMFKHFGNCPKELPNEIISLLLARLPKKEKALWDNPPREIQDTDYRLGEKIGYNSALQELKKLLTVEVEFPMYKNGNK